MAYVDTSTAHALDEEFDGILTALTLTGGLAPPEEIARYLGSRDAAEALIKTCDKRRFGHMWPVSEVRSLHGDPGRGPVPRVDLFIERDQVMWALVGDERGDLSSGYITHGCRVTGALHRFMYALETGRTMMPVMLEAMTGGYVKGGPRHRSLMMTWRALGEVGQMYFERDADGISITTPLMLTWVLGFNEAVDALPHVAHALGTPLRWRWLTGSPFEAERARRLAVALADEWPVPVQIEVVELATSRYLVEPSLWSTLGLPVGPLPAPRHPRWVVAPDLSR